VESGHVRTFGRLPASAATLAQNNNPMPAHDRPEQQADRRPDGMSRSGNWLSQSNADASDPWLPRLAEDAATLRDLARGDRERVGIEAWGSAGYLLGRTVTPSPHGMKCPSNPRCFMSCAVGSEATHS
jgi:hypothetical protein